MRLDIIGSYLAQFGLLSYVTSTFSVVHGSRVTSHGRHLQHLQPTLHGILTQHIEFEEEPCATLVALIH